MTSQVQFSRGELLLLLPKDEHLLTVVPPDKCGDCQIAWQPELATHRHFPVLWPCQWCDSQTRGYYISFGDVVF
jgi:hypothetical protein